MDKSNYRLPEVSNQHFENSIRTEFFLQKRRNNTLPVNPYMVFNRHEVYPVESTYAGPRTEADSRGHDSFTSAITRGSLLNMTGKSCDINYLLENHVAIVNNRLLDKIRNREIDLGVSLGEFRSTAGLITGTLSKLTTGLKTLRRRGPSAALRVLTGEKNNKWKSIPNVAASTHLVLTYGVRPLLSDVYASMQILERGLQRIRDAKYSVRTQSTKLVTGHIYDTWSDDLYGSVRVSGRCDYHIENPLMRTLDQVGLVNPLNVAWELVPFSFVADWFLPIGDWINGFVPPQGVSNVTGYLTVSASAVHQSRTSLPPPGGGINGELGWHTKMDSTEIYKKRELIVGLPKFTCVVPDVSLTANQIASGLALLQQVVINKKRDPLFR